MISLKLQEKITGLLLFYFLIALVAISSTLYVSWRLEGGAAAINDAGSERMRSFHIAFLLAQQVQHPSVELRRDIEAKTAQFEKVRAQMAKLHKTWQTDVKPRIRRILDATHQAKQEAMLMEYRVVVENFVD